jgi:phage gp36-like protein
MFATADDMRARPDMGEEVLVQLTGQTEWNAQVIAAVNRAIVSATTTAEGFVAKYYGPAPGREVPPMVTDIVCDLAFVKLHRAMTDDLKDRRDQAMRLLRDISNGLVKIDQGKQDIPARAGAVIVPDRPRTFSRDSLGGF